MYIFCKADTEKKQIPFFMLHLKRFDGQYIYVKFNNYERFLFIINKNINWLKLVAKKSHDEECGWMGGCNYYLNFTSEYYYLWFSLFQLMLY